MSDPRLDRIPFFDPRSKEFPIRPLLTTVRQPRSYTWRMGQQLDQGQEGACTGFSQAMEAEARPVVVAVTDELARRIYYRAREIDAANGLNFPEGATVIGSMKARIEILGDVTEYRWVLGPGPQAAENDLALTLSYRGPVVLGTYWWTGMFRADSDGFLNPTGSREGGHAYIVNSFSRKRDAYYVPNSWGGEGAGWIRRLDMVRLLDEDGEGCVMATRRKP